MYLVEILSYGQLAILDEILLHEARFLEELVKTALSDVVDHLLGKVGCLLFGYLSLELANLSA